MSRLEPSQGSSQGRHRVRVYRVDDGETALIRILSASRSVTGCWTHYHTKKERSYYCPGNGCPSCAKKERGQWKGYVAALGWKLPEKMWIPVVCEITESCELDMRGVIARGQEWELSRAKEASQKREPVRAALKGTIDLAELPRAFDVLPTVLGMYHELHMDLSMPNPMPARVFMELVEGAPPIADQVEAVEQPAEYVPLTERLKQRGSATSKNGKIHT